jgi:hypothetical protein
VGGQTRGGLRRVPLCQLHAQAGHHASATVTNKQTVASSPMACRSHGDRGGVSQCACGPTPCCLPSCCDAKCIPGYPCSYLMTLRLWRCSTSRTAAQVRIGPQAPGPEQRAAHQ